MLQVHMSDDVCQVHLTFPCDTTLYGALSLLSPCGPPTSIPPTHPTYLQSPPSPSLSMRPFKILNCAPFTCRKIFYWHHTFLCILKNVVQNEHLWGLNFVSNFNEVFKQSLCICIQLGRGLSRWRKGFNLLPWSVAKCQTSRLRETPKI